MRPAIDEHIVFKFEAYFGAWQGSYIIKFYIRQYVPMSKFVTDKPIFVNVFSIITDKKVFFFTMYAD